MPDNAIALRGVEQSFNRRPRGPTGGRVPGVKTQKSTVLGSVSEAWHVPARRLANDERLGNLAP